MPHICFTIALIILRDTLWWRAVCWCLSQAPRWPSSCLQQAAWSCCCPPQTDAGALFEFFFRVDRETSSGFFSWVFLCVFYDWKFEFQVVLFIFAAADQSISQCDTQCVYMTLKKTELLCQSDYDVIFKMHVFTLVWLKSDWIRFLIVGLKHPDYWLIVSLLLHVNVPSDRIGFYILCRREIFPPGPWAGSRRTAASFLPNHHKKERKRERAPLCIKSV